MNIKIIKRILLVFLSLFIERILDWLLEWHSNIVETLVIIIGFVVFIDLSNYLTRYYFNKKIKREPILLAEWIFWFLGIGSFIGIATILSDSFFWILILLCIFLFFLIKNIYYKKSELIIDLKIKDEDFTDEKINIYQYHKKSNKRLIIIILVLSILTLLFLYSVGIY